MSKAKKQNRIPNAINTRYIKQPWELKTAFDFIDEPWRMMHIYREHAGKHAALYFVLSIPFLVSGVLLFFDGGGVNGDALSPAILFGSGCLFLFFALRYYQMAKRNIAEKQLQTQKRRHKHLRSQ